jgi:hypothetical protein
VANRADVDVGLGTREFFFTHFSISLKEQCPWIGLMFAVRHVVHRHGQRWVRNRRQQMTSTP